MLDIKLLRETPDVVRADLRKRGRDPSVVDEIRALDEQWRQANAEMDRLRATRNKIAPLIGKLKQAHRAAIDCHFKLSSAVAAMQEYWHYRERSHGFWDKVFEGERKAYRAFFTGARDWAVQGLLFPQQARLYVVRYNEVIPHIGLEKNQALLGKADLLLARLTDIVANAPEIEKMANVALTSAQGLTPNQREQYFQTVNAWPALRTAEVDQLRTVLLELDAPSSTYAGEISARIAQLEQLAKHAMDRRDTLHRTLPNIMHETVPIGKDDSQNVPIRWWGDAKLHNFPAVSHVDLLTSLDVADLERAARAAGARFYYAKGDLVLLGRALEFFALTRLASKGFTAVEPPYMLRREAMEGAVDLADFESVIYKVEAEAKEPPLYLIATSEHPIAALHMGEIVATSQLPLKYAGVSPCFRKEAGAHGKDTKGIFRVHQFSKVEQFVFCKAEESWAMHEELIANAEELFRELGIPYRVVNICTGDLGSIAAKKYDIEAWMPVQGAYREVVSCSNCTDFQARRYNTRHRANPGDPTEIVHTLNSTAIAVQRTLVAILENFQQADGSVAIPKVLQPYVGKAKMEPAKK